MVQFLDFRKKDQELDKGINLAGVINSEIMIKKCNNGTRMQRIGLILPCRSQAVIDLWSDSEENRPTFAKKWESLQLIFAFDLAYAGEIYESGKVIKVFRASKKQYKLARRFIWLSEDIKNFWDDPIEEYRKTFDLVQEAYQVWPLPIPTGKGKLKRSPGSIFGKLMGYWSKNFNTEDIEPFSFSDLQRLHIAVRKSLCGFVNILTGEKSKGDLVFQR